MLTVEPITHIRRDERGVAWIAEANTKVKEIVLDQLAYGWDAHEIHRQHPPSPWRKSTRRLRPITIIRRKLTCRSSGIRRSMSNCARSCWPG